MADLQNENICARAIILNDSENTLIGGTKLKSHCSRECCCRDLPHQENAPVVMKKTKKVQRGTGSLQRSRSFNSSSSEKQDQRDYTHTNQFRADSYSANVYRLIHTSLYFVLFVPTTLYFPVIYISSHTEAWSCSFSASTASQWVAFHI